MKDYKNYILMLIMSVALIGCDANVRDDEAGDDAEDVAYFPLNNLPFIPFESHIEIINKFLELELVGKE